MRFCRWLVTLYPRAFRNRFGCGMEAALCEEYARARARGRAAALRFLAIAAVHAIAFGVAERLPRASTLRSFVSADLRDALRALRAAPLVTAVSVLSLTLGIGANSALFSILNTIAIRQLPVHEPERLVILGGSDWSNPVWEEIRARQFDLFESAGAWSLGRFNLAAAGRTDPVTGAYCSGGLFHTLGVDATLGRPLTTADDVRGGGPLGHVAVISHRFWQQRFGGRPDVLGERLTVNRVSFTVVGVTAPGFLGPEVGEAVDLFLPLAAEAAIRGPQSVLEGRSSSWLQVIGRLKPGQTIESATAALEASRPAILAATVPLDWPADYRASYLKTALTLLPGATGVSTLRTRFEQAGRRARGENPRAELAQAEIPVAGFAVTARVTSNRADVEPRIAAAVVRAAPDISFSLRDYSDQVNRTVAQERLVAALSGLFAVLALLLAAVGLYGVTAYAVRRRLPEIAVRMALGATAFGVLRLVLRRVAMLIAIGGIIGAGLSLWASAFIAPLLFAVDARDPVTMFGAFAVLGAVGLFSGWLPARQASRLDPAATLRG